MTEAGISHPIPVADNLTQFFWDEARAQRLSIQRCGDCGLYVHVPKVICPFCLSENLGHAEVSGLGTVYSFTFVEHQYHPGLPTPYILATVELDEQPGLRLVSNITDCQWSDVEIGARVRVWFDEVAPQAVLPKFRLDS